MPIKNSRRSVSWRTWLGVQLGFGAAFASSWLWLSTERRHEVIARMTHQPVELDVDLSKTICGDVGPLYDAPEVISEDDLAAVLKKIVPRFSRSHLRPNLVEHALRTWGSKIVFNN